MRQREIERLAKMKAEKKQLEEQIKELEAKLLPEGEEAYDTPHGILKRMRRSNVEILDNMQLIQESIITESIFIQNAKLPITKLKNIVGEKGYNDLLAAGVVLEKAPTEYYQLNPKPKNGENGKDDKSKTGSKSTRSKKKATA